MFETLLKLYVTYMTWDVRSPVPHLFGPPGCGKSLMAQQLSEVITDTRRAADPKAPACKLHIINVSRISPLELEGVQMPHGEGEDMQLKLLTATYWKALNEGDIILFDEFLRGFPEVYNGLLDIFTARHVAGFDLPKVFIMAASNSVVTYDKALDDRLLHLAVADPRNKKGESNKLARLIVNELGLVDSMVSSIEMGTLLSSQVLPMYKVLDDIEKGNTGGTYEGKSIRNLLGQAKLREVQTKELRDLIEANNNLAFSKQHYQHVILLDGKSAAPDFEETIREILSTKADKLTPVQLLNMRLNLQLLEMEKSRREKEGTEDDEQSIFDADVIGI